MTQKTTHKTPEELEEAVGKKIDELFGDLFTDEPSEKPQEDTPAEVGSGDTKVVRKPHSDSSAAKEKVPGRPARQAVRPTSPTRSDARTPAAPSGTAAVERPKSEPQPTSVTPKPKAGNAFEDMVEQMDILLLNLEWEVSAESIAGLIGKFKDLERFFPKEGQARTILAMNQRALQRFSGRDAVPHPALVKLVQDSLNALRSIHSSRGTRPAGDTLIAGISDSYRDIMAAGAGQAPESEPRPKSADQRRLYVSVVNNVGGAIHSLEEVSQRLARILGVLRQGGDMSTEEITRRLGTLEQLLTERVGQLLSFHKELVAVPPPPASDGGRSGDGASLSNAVSPDGLVMVTWQGIGLAIPSSFLSAVYPLTETLAEEFQRKQTIKIRSKRITRLPLKRPSGVDRADSALPTWLIQVSYYGKEFFLLADRLVGFREIPEQLDILSRSRIKVGAGWYIVLKPAVSGTV